MSEAIGALDTAVGVISLGIQVCQGLYRYVDAVRSRDKDLDETAQQVQRLTLILAALAALIPRIASLPNKNSGAIQALESCIKGSHDSVLVLQKLHQSLERRPSSLAKEKAKEIGRHLAFPFLKSEFASLRENVSSLGANTALALQVIQS
jgi:ankyrin repeat domain-containing protein 50